LIIGRGGTDEDPVRSHANVPPQGRSMIRAFEPSDMEDVLELWLEASAGAHDFVGREFWESKVDDMRNRYLPAAETHVFVQGGRVRGFVSLQGDTLAALFVSPAFQGRGLGRRLMDRVKRLRDRLELTVYRENQRAVRFYRRCGFAVVGERTDPHTGHAEVLMEYGPGGTVPALPGG